LLAQQAVAMDTNDERYLLDTTNVARLDQPKITATGSASVAQKDSITFSGAYGANEIVEFTVNGVRLQYITTAGDTANSIATNIATQFTAAANNAGNSAVTASASSGTITLEAKKPGVPFTASVVENSSTGSAVRAD
jgi:phage tail sheath gpL-like